jgi:CHRD domain-containing protein
MWKPLRPFFLFPLALAILAPVGVLRARPAAAAGDTLIAFTALLNGAQQSPPEPSPSTGVALVLYDKTASIVCWRISFSPLAGSEILAHFHGPGAPGVNAPIRINITPSPSPVGSPKHGCAPINKDDAKSLSKGLLYINIHSTVAPNGEIRGQVLPTNVKYKVDTTPASPSGAFLN